MSSIATDVSALGASILNKGFIFEAFASCEELGRHQKGTDKKTCMYSLLTRTFTAEDKCVTAAAVPAPSLLTFQSVEQNFTRMLLSLKTLDIFCRKPDRPLIIHVLEDSGTILILFPWLLTHVITTYIFCHSTIMTCQRKHVIIQAGKHFTKTSSTFL